MSYFNEKGIDVLYAISQFAKAYFSKYNSYEKRFTASVEEKYKDLKGIENQAELSKRHVIVSCNPFYIVGRKDETGKGFFPERLCLQSRYRRQHKDFTVSYRVPLLEEKIQNEFAEEEFVYSMQGKLILFYQPETHMMYLFWRWNNVGYVNRNYVFLNSILNLSVFPKTQIKSPNASYSKEEEEEEEEVISELEEENEMKDRKRKRKRKYSDLSVDSIFEVKKRRKEYISLVKKRVVWNTHIGEEIGKTKCLCCGITDIYQISFHCGHIVSEHNGGNAQIANLIPICQCCNSSMGTKNFYDFRKDCGFG
jgi:5-methylcytosine-specific restriction endonuclease McrA